MPVVWIRKLRHIEMKGQPRHTHHELESAAEDPSSHSSWIPADPRTTFSLGIYCVSGTVPGTSRIRSHLYLTTTQ